MSSLPVIDAVTNPELGLTAKEQVAEVDENDNVIRPISRAEMRAQKLRHRATYIFAKNSKDEFYVQKRSAIKDYCPGYYEIVSGGCVQYGESYEENAYRELEEELGIRNTPMEHLFKFYYENNVIKTWGDAWECTYDGPLTLQVEEVDSVHPMTMEQIFIEIRRGEEEESKKQKEEEKKGENTTSTSTSISESESENPGQRENEIMKFTPDSIFAAKKYIEMKNLNISH